MRATLLTSILILGVGCGEGIVSDSTNQTSTDEGGLSSVLSLTPASVALPPGGTATVHVSFAGHSTLAWKLSTRGLPAGVTGVFSSPALSGGQSATLTLTASNSSGSAGAFVDATTPKGTVRTATLQVDVVAHLPVGGGSGTGGGVSTGGGSPTGGGMATGGGAPTGGGAATGGGTATGGGVGTGAIGPTGGRVDLLKFATTGDTRPPACEDTAHYPTAIINGIVDAAQAQGAQFGLDLGDHMYVCNNDLATATTHMNLYMQSIHRFTNQWFMTMGNHECWHGPCLAGSTNANYVAFMSALSPVSSLPYYTFNVDTRLGRATFIVLADNAWDATQSAWFEHTLSVADTAAKYTIVARHHPEGDTSVATNPEAVTILRRHKFALFLTGHAHSYTHQTTDNGRDVVIGIGGAPLLASGATYNGYAMVEQQPTGELRLTVYGITGNTVHDTFTVGPNQ